MMPNTIKILTPVALVVALSLTALPAAAQRQRGERQRGGDRTTTGQAISRSDDSRAGAPRQGASQNSRQQAEAPRANQNRQQNRGNDAQQPSRGYSNQQPNRGNDYGRYDGRQYNDRGRFDTGRSYVAPRGASRSYYQAPRYRPYFFSRPFYTFIPRLHIGFGLWIGYPVPYPYGYVSAYPPPVYGYPGASINMAPGAGSYGGLSFDISPAHADLYVDGEYIGAVGDFVPNAQPLTLVPGQHRIEVQADGYRPMVWDVNIAPGQVIPYRGAMQPY